MLNKFAAACLLSFAALPAFAAEDFRSEYRVHMGEAEFRQAHEKFLGEGMRLVDITVSESGGRPVIGAIWQRFANMPAPSPERTKAQLGRIFLKLDEAALRATGQRMGQEGSTAELIDAYVVDGKTWFAASFAPPKEAPMQNVGAFLTREQLEGMREDAQKQDLDLWHVDAYTDGNELKLLPAFVPRRAADVEFEVFDGTLAISARNAGMYLADMHPLSISVFESAGQTGWFAAWDTGPERNFILTDDGTEIARAVAGGSVVVDIDSQADRDGKVRYYAVVQPMK
jgi:hypothetical protein